LYEGMLRSTKVGKGFNFKKVGYDATVLTIARANQGMPKIEAPLIVWNNN